MKHENNVDIDCFNSSGEWHIKHSLKLETSHKMIVMDELRVYEDNGNLQSAFMTVGMEAQSDIISLDGGE